MTTEERKDNTVKKSSKNAYVKNKKPKFRRQESWRLKRVTDRWRRPHGIDSKMRKKVKGWPASPTVGYQSPKATRGLHPSGYVETRVFNVEDLAGVDPEIQVVRVAHTVGAKKRFEIIAAADEQGIHVLNSRKARADFEETENGED
ncbi:MAG: 50S ribosomal protein L32e [Candidatus Bathyarchaeota archaeon]